MASGDPCQENATGDEMVPPSGAPSTGAMWFWHDGPAGMLKVRWEESSVGQRLPKRVATYQSMDLPPMAAVSEVEDVVPSIAAVPPSALAHSSYSEAFVTAVQENVTGDVVDAPSLGVSSVDGVVVHDG